MNLRRLGVNLGEPEAFTSTRILSQLRHARETETRAEAVLSRSLSHRLRQQMSDDEEVRKGQRGGEKKKTVTIEILSGPSLSLSRSLSLFPFSQSLLPARSVESIRAATVVVYKRRRSLRISLFSSNSQIFTSLSFSSSLSLSLCCDPVVYPFLLLL